jgi:hypothetical protein
LPLGRLLLSALGKILGKITQLAQMLVLLLLSHKMLGSKLGKICVGLLFWPAFFQKASGHPGQTRHDALLWMITLALIGVVKIKKRNFEKKIFLALTAMLKKISVLNVSK